MSSYRILIAGIGNVFLGDDAFGVETVRGLMGRPWPAGVVARDFGIRGHDLVFALMDGYETVILVDSVSRGKPPGTIYELELEFPLAGSLPGSLSGGHSLDPLTVLQFAAALGAHADRLYLVGCEPAVLDPGDGEMQLSAAVRAAVPVAVGRIEVLVATLLRFNRKPERGPVLAVN